MRFLYGDASLSPLKRNYIELLREVMDLGVGILQAHDEVVELDKERAALKAECEERLVELRFLRGEVGSALSRFSDADKTTTQDCAASLQGLLDQEIDRTEGEVRGELARGEERIKAATRAAWAGNKQRLEGMLLKHDMPEAEQRIEVSLVEGERYVAELRGNTEALGLSWAMSLDIPESHLLGAALRMDRIAPQLAIKVPEEAGWVRKSIKLRSYKLTKHYLIGIHQTATTALKLRDNLQTLDSGYDLHFAVGARKLKIQRLTKGSLEEPFDPTPEDATELFRIFDEIRAACDEVAVRRVKLLDARLDGKPLEQHAEARLLVQRLVGMIAPAVREISKRSLSPNELVLKRVLADDRREEIFLPKADLLDKIAPLPEYLALDFDPLALTAPHPSQQPPPVADGPASDRDEGSPSRRAVSDAAAAAASDGEAVEDASEPPPKKKRRGASGRPSRRKVKERAQRTSMAAEALRAFAGDGADEKPPSSAAPKSSRPSRSSEKTAGDTNASEQAATAKDVSEPPASQPAASAPAPVPSEPAAADAPGPDSDRMSSADDVLSEDEATIVRNPSEAIVAAIRRHTVPYAGAAKTQPGGTIKPGMPSPPRRSGTAAEASSPPADGEQGDAPGEALSSAPPAVPAPSVPPKRPRMLEVPDIPRRQVTLPGNGGALKPPPIPSRLAEPIADEATVVTEQSGDESVEVLLPDFDD